MLFIDRVAVLPGTARMAPAIGGGYAVSMTLHRLERVEGLEPIMLFGSFRKSDAMELMRVASSLREGVYILRNKRIERDWNTSVLDLQERMAVK